MTGVLFTLILIRLCYGINMIKLPEVEYVADNLCFPVRESITTHSSPGTAVKHFQTSLVRTRTSCQSHCKSK